MRIERCWDARLCIRSNLVYGERRIDDDSVLLTEQHILRWPGREDLKREQGFMTHVVELSEETYHKLQRVAEQEGRYSHSVAQSYYFTPGRLRGSHERAGPNRASNGKRTPPRWTPAFVTALIDA